MDLSQNRVLAANVQADAWLELYRRFVGICRLSVPTALEIGSQPPEYFADPDFEFEPGVSWCGVAYATPPLEGGAAEWNKLATSQLTRFDMGNPLPRAHKDELLRGPLLMKTVLFDQWIADLESLLPPT